MTSLTGAELAHRAGTTPEWIERPAELGILEHGEGERPFGARDIHLGDIGRRGLPKPVPLFRAAIRDSSSAG